MDFTFTIGGSTHRVSVDFKDGLYSVNAGNEKWTVDAQLISENCLSLLFKRETRVIYLAENEGKKFLFIDGDQFSVEQVETTARTGAVSSAPVAEGLQVVTPVMPGKVVKVQVSEGESVEKDQTLVIVEAMKMENEMRAPSDGIVKKIHVSPGDFVNLGQPMVELEMGS